MESNADAPLAPALNPEALAYVIDHVFLPPKLPESDDTEASHERVLLQHVHSTLKAFQQLHHDVGGGVSDRLQGVARCILMVQRMISVRVDGALDAARLDKELKEMESGGMLLLSLT